MSSWKYNLSRKNAELKVSIQGQKNVKKMLFFEKLRFLRFIYYFSWYLVYVNQKNMLNLNKILMKAKIIKKMKILLSKAGLRELLRLEPCTGD